MSEKCQVEITPEHGPFVLGPPPRASQCTNDSVVMLVEKEPGEDGERGRMRVCATCLNIAYAQGLLDTCEVVGVEAS